MVYSIYSAYSIYRVYRVYSCRCCCRSFSACGLLFPLQFRNFAVDMLIDTIDLIDNYRPYIYYHYYYYYTTIIIPPTAMNKPENQKSQEIQEIPQELQSIFRRVPKWQELWFYQKTEVLYQMTYVFCERFLPRHGDRTVDQMRQAARSGKQNIVEGSEDGKTSTAMELNLLNVARSSISELRLDYEDHLKAHHLAVWTPADARFQPMHLPAHPKMRRVLRQRCCQGNLPQDLSHLRRLRSDPRAAAHASRYYADPKSLRCLPRYG